MKKSSPKSKKRGTRRKAPASKAPEAISKEGAEAPRVQEKKELKKKSYPAAPKREIEKKSSERGSLFRYWHIAVQFLRESKMELKKVKWPTRKELLASTGVVIVLVLVVSFFLGLIDFGLIKIIRNIVG